MTIQRTKYGIKDVPEEMEQDEVMQPRSPAGAPGTGLGMGDSLESRAEVRQPLDVEPVDEEEPKPSMLDSLRQKWRDSMGAQRKHQDILAGMVAKPSDPFNPSQEELAAIEETTSPYMSMGSVQAKKPLNPFLTNPDKQMAAAIQRAKDVSNVAEKARFDAGIAHQKALHEMDKAERLKRTKKLFR